MKRAQIMHLLRKSAVGSSGVFLKGGGKNVPAGRRGRFENKEKEISSHPSILCFVWEKRANEYSWKCGRGVAEQYGWFIVPGNACRLGKKPKRLRRSSP